MGRQDREEKVGEARIVKLPSFQVVGMKYHGTIEDNTIPQLWRDFHPRIPEIKGILKPQHAYGIGHNFDHAAGVFDYLAAYEVESLENIPAGMEGWHIPEKTYAVFESTLPGLSDTFRHIYQIWMPESGYRRAEGPEFELYGPSFQPEGAASRLEIYIPIEEA